MVVLNTTAECESGRKNSLKTPIRRPKLARGLGVQEAAKTQPRALPAPGKRVVAEWHFLDHQTRPLRPEIQKKPAPRKMS